MVTVVLRGGLGNQMFQYAAARALATDCGAHLSIDDISGFRRDRIYKRSYLLDRVGVSDPFISSAARLSVTLRAIEKKFHRGTEGSLVIRPYGCFLLQTKELTPANLGRLALPRNFFMDGYWQDEGYFKAHAAPIAEVFLKGLDKMEPAFRPRASDVAIGVRLYEEVTDPGSKFQLGREAAIQTLRTQIDFFERQGNLRNLHIFSTMDRDSLIALGFPKQSIFLTPDLGYTDPISLLNLLSHFQNHVITPSTFYWWGAWLANQRFSGRSDVRIVGRLDPLRVPRSWIQL
jgi:hypothetical protein